MVDPEISTKDHAGEFDCIETAKPGEILFALQGLDKLAPPTVLFWAGLARTAGMKMRPGKKRDELLRRATSAENVAWKMQDQQAKGIEIDDAPPAVEVERTVEGDLRAARIKAVAAVHDIIGRSVETRDMLTAAGFDNYNNLDRAIEHLKYAADSIEPRSAHERT